MNRTDPILDRHILEVVPLVSPRTVREAVPLTRENEGLVRTSRDALADVLDGRDDRVVVVVGPCSVHDTDAALEYACRLEELARELREDLLVVMRVYFEKPRTTVGWKGLVNDPRLDGSHHVDEGLMVARRLLVAILSLGLPVGCEFLDPTTPHYIADAVSWGAIGARTSQSQVHRQLASGLSMPVGFKNSTDGGVQSAVDGVSVAARPQSFLGVDDDGSAAVISTRGNPDCHVVLRGSDAGPNYAKSDVEDRSSDCPSRAQTADRDRRQPREQRQGPPPPGGCRSGDRRADQPGGARARWRDARELSPCRPSGPRPRQCLTSPLRPEHHRQLYRLGRDLRTPGGPRQSCFAAPGHVRTVIQAQRGRRRPRCCVSVVTKPRYTW